jgi:hypothetical protein
MTAINKLSKIIDHESMIDNDTYTTITKDRYDNKIIWMLE